MFRLPDWCEPLLADRTHGSSVLVGDVARALAMRRIDLAPDDYVRLASELLRRRPQFALLHHLLHSTGVACFGGVPPSGLRVWQAAARWLEEWQRARLGIELPPAVPAAPLRLLTWSHSGTVLEWIRRLHSRHPGVHVLCARSLPGGEGERMAEQLAGVKVGAEALNDDAALDAVAVSTWVVVGADALEAARFWNKVGTRELLRRAAASGRPVLVIAETAKWCHPSWELAPQTPQTAPGVFEPTDNQLVTFFVTDRGSWPPGALASHLDTPPCFSPLVSGP